MQKIEGAVEQPKPRIAMLVAGDKFGGAERQLLTLCAGSQDRFESVIYQTLSGPLTREAHRAGFEVSRLLEDRSLLSSGLALAKDLREKRIDLIHTHGYRGAAIAALAILFGRRLPVVRTWHGAPEMFGSLKMGLYELIGIAAGLYSRATSVYVSHELVNKMHARKRSTVIYNGIQLPGPIGPRPGDYSGWVNVVAAGRLEPVKGLQYLVKAVAHPALKERVRVHLVGDGPDRAMLEGLVSRLGIQRNVRFHGFKSNVLDFIGHADFLALPSLHEGVPYVLLEALALRTPVIASDVGGIPEVVRHGQEAVLISPRCAEEITRALRRTMPDPLLGERLRREGFERVSGEFSASKMVERYADLYDGLLPQV
jgi:L-malate glycosyltransferase